MKKTQKGFIVPLLASIIAILLIGGGGYYLYSINRGPNCDINKNIPSTFLYKSTSEVIPSNYLIDYEEYNAQIKLYCGTSSPQKIIQYYYCYPGGNNTTGGGGGRYANVCGNKYWIGFESHSMGPALNLPIYGPFDVSSITDNLISTTTDVTANWKTYSNTEQNFQINYPVEWTYTPIVTGVSDNLLSITFNNLSNFSLAIGVWKKSSFSDLTAESPNTVSENKTITNLNNDGWKIMKNEESLVGDAGVGGTRIVYTIYNQNSNPDKFYRLNCGVNTLPNFDLCEKVVKTFKFSTPTTSVETNFTATGNLVKNNPGLKPDVWYLIYEKPGAPALRVELKFNNVDTTSFSQGERVSIEGMLQGSVVTVSRITP